MTPKTAISVLLIMGIIIAAVFVYLLNNKELKFTDKKAEKTIVENNKATDTGALKPVDNNKEERKSLEEFQAGSKEYIQEVQVRKTELNELKQVNDHDAAGTTAPAPALNEEEAMKALQRLKELNK